MAAKRAKGGDASGGDGPKELFDALRQAASGLDAAPPPPDAPVGLRAFFIERAVPLLAPERLGKARRMADLTTDPATIDAFVAHMTAHFHTLDPVTQAVLRGRYDIDDTAFLSADALAARLKIPAREVLLKEQEAFAAMKAAAKAFRADHPL